MVIKKTSKTFIYPGDIHQNVENLWGKPGFSTSFGTLVNIKALVNGCSSLKIWRCSITSYYIPIVSLTISPRYPPKMEKGSIIHPSIHVWVQYFL